MTKIWVTRAQPGADATADRLRGLGLEPVVAPLLELRLATPAQPDLGGVGAIAFSSANGVAAFAALSSERSPLVYAVGKATAEAARRAGFAQVRAGDADVAALARLIVEDAARPIGAVLHICPTEPAGDLVGALEAEGIEARRAVLYGAFPVECVPAAVAPLLEAGQIAGALVHSPKAARTLSDLARDRRWLTAVRTYALSAACAQPLQEAGFVSPLVAASPNEDALLSLIPR